MPTIAEIKQKYPDLADSSDDEVVDALHEAFYSDLPRERIATSLGVKTAPPTAKPRTWGQAASDTGRAVMGGMAGLVKSGGDLYGLASGDMNNAASELARNAQEYWTEGQSQPLKDKITARKAAIDASDSTLGKFGTAIKETVTDPALMGDVVASNIATMVPGMAAGRAVQSAMAARALAAGPITEAAAGAAAHGAAKVATGVAVGTGAVQQGADVSSQAYDDSIKKTAAELSNHPDFVSRVQNGEAPRDVAMSMGLSAARAAFLPAVAISVAANAIPGGTMLERALIGGAARDTIKAGTKYALPKAMLKAGLGEAGQETLEEGGGQFAANVAKQRFVDPNQDLSQDVGENAGMGFAGGLGMGVPGGALHRKHAVKTAGDVIREDLQPGGGPLATAVNAGVETAARQADAVLGPTESQAPAAPVALTAATVAAIRALPAEQQEEAMKLHELNLRTDVAPGVLRHAQRRLNAMLGDAQAADAPPAAAGAPPQAAPGAAGNELDQNLAKTEAALRASEAAVQPPEERKPLALPVAPFIQDAIQRSFTLGNRFGLVDRIEELAAEGKTAQAIVNELGADLDPVRQEAALNGADAGARIREFVREIRTGLGVPSMDEPADLAKWQTAFNQRRMDAGKGANGQAAPTTTQASAAPQGSDEAGAAATAPDTQPAGLPTTGPADVQAAGVKRAAALRKARAIKGTTRPQTETGPRDLNDDVNGLAALDDKRLAHAPTAEYFKALPAESGWAQVGGQMLRAPLEDGQGHDGEITGRTPWIAASDWYGAMQRDGKTNLPNGQHGVQSVIDRAIAGDALTTQERRAARFMLEVAEQNADPLSALNLARDQLKDEYDQSALEDAGVDKLAPEEVEALAALLREAESLGIDTETIRSDASSLESDRDYHEAVTAAVEDLLTRAREEAGQPGAGSAEGSPDSSRGPSGQQDQAESTREPLTLTAPTKAQVLAQQDALEAEQAARDAPADTPRSNLTGEQVDIFNPQGGVFDVPAEPAAPPAEPKHPNARTKKIAGRSATGIAADEEARAAYFAPGNIIRSYGGFDEVLAYNAPTSPGGSWSVKVHSVKEVTPDQWVRIGKPQDARTHSTQPDARQLKRGPEGRAAPQAGEEVPYSEPRADGRPFPNAPDRGVVTPVASAPTSAADPTNTPERSAELVELRKRASVLESLLECIG